MSPGEGGKLDCDVHLSVFFRGEKIHTSVQRMFRIWKERKVYDNGFLHELEQLIGTWEETIYQPI